MDQNIIEGVAVLGTVFLLVVILGLQIQISILVRRIKDVTDKLSQK